MAPAAGPELAVVAIQQSRERFKKTLEEAEARAKSENIEVEAELAEGNAVEAIVKKAKEETSN